MRTHSAAAFVSGLSVAALAGAPALAATTSFSLGQNRPVSPNGGAPVTTTVVGRGGSGSSLAYTVDGIKLTFSDQAGVNSPQLQRNGNGLCALMNFSTALATGDPFCGQNTEIADETPIAGQDYSPVPIPARQTLTSISFKFDKSVVLKSYTAAAAAFQVDGTPTGTPVFGDPGQVGPGIVNFNPTFTSGLNVFNSPTISFTVGQGTPNTTATFVNSQSGANCTPDTQNTARCTINFSPNYVVNAGELVTITTPTFLNATGSPISANGHWRLFGLEVEEVPGPLPLMGGAAAFGWSRRLRKRISQSKQNLPHAAA